MIKTGSRKYQPLPPHNLPVYWDTHRRGGNQPFMHLSSMVSSRCNPKLGGGLVGIEPTTAGACENYAFLHRPANHLRHSPRNWESVGTTSHPHGHLGGGFNVCPHIIGIWRVIHDLDKACRLYANANNRIGKLIFFAPQSRDVGYKAHPELVLLNQPEIMVIADSFPPPDQSCAKNNPTKYRCEYSAYQQRNICKT